MGVFSIVLIIYIVDSESDGKDYIDYFLRHALLIDIYKPVRIYN